MRKQRIKEIIQEINSITLEKIYVISGSNNYTNQIVTDDSMKDEAYMSMLVRCAAQHKFDLTKKLYDLDMKEQDLYDELIALTKWEKA